MNKYLVNGFLLVSLGFAGCQVPQVPESAKVSSYSGTGSTVTNTNTVTSIQNLPENQKLACEYIYCSAHQNNKELDSLCKPSKNKVDSITNKFSSFEFNKKQKVIDEFIEMCPYPSFIGSPFK